MEAEKSVERPFRRHFENGAQILAAIAVGGAVKIAIAAGDETRERSRSVRIVEIHQLGEHALGSHPENRTHLFAAASGGGAVEIAVTRLEETGQRNSAIGSGKLHQDRQRSS